MIRKWFNWIQPVGSQENYQKTTIDDGKYVHFPGNFAVTKFYEWWLMIVLRLSLTVRDCQMFLGNK